MKKISLVSILLSILIAFGFMAYLPSANLRADTTEIENNDEIDALSASTTITIQDIFDSNKLGAFSLADGKAKIIFFGSIAYCTSCQSVFNSLVGQMSNIMFENATDLYAFNIFNVGDDGYTADDVRASVNPYTNPFVYLSNSLTDERENSDIHDLYYMCFHHAEDAGLIENNILFMPLVAIIDGDGNILETIIGYHDNDYIRRFLSRSLMINRGFTLIPRTDVDISRYPGIVDFVERCYEIALGRPSDYAGLVDWVTKIVSGELCGTQVAYGFVYSNEMQNANLSNEQYVDRLYHIFMGRDPDDGGFQDWVGKLNDGTLSRDDVFAGFANADEFYEICNDYGCLSGVYFQGIPIDSQGQVNYFVSWLYNILLLREADRQGHASWVNALVSGQLSGREVASGFMCSPEFTRRVMSDATYISLVYVVFLRRSADCDGLNNWLHAMNGGMTRGAIFEEFVRSQEYVGLCQRMGIRPY